MMIPFLYALFSLFVATPITTSFVLPQTITTPARRLCPSLYYQSQGKEEFSCVEQKPKTEYAALSPGSAVQIKVGNVTLARKAWKKRRRSGSPLLVPCSVLSMDRKSMVRWNILYLLQKFGKPLDEVEEGAVGFLSSDICLSMGDINKHYSRHLGTSLTKHAKDLGHETARSLVRELFNRQTQKDIGIRIWLAPKEEESDDEDGRSMWLMAPLSRQRAHRMASQAGLLQFTKCDQENNSMQHTGILRTRNKADGNRIPHTFSPLSAALRVSQRAVDSGIIRDGSVHAAVVFSLDSAGDGGSPLLTLSLNPTRGQVRDRLKLRAAGKRHFAKDRRLDIVGQVERSLTDLKAGDGPFVGKVMRMSTRSGAAFIDCGVGRAVSEHKGGGVTRVLGMLRFDDLVKAALSNDDVSMELLEKRSTMSDDEGQFIEDSLYNDGWDDDDDDDWDDDDDNDDDFMTIEDLANDTFDDEDDEVSKEEDGDVDITDLLTVAEDGVVSYKDPETGETVIVSESDLGNESDDDENDMDSMFTGLTSQERLELLTRIVKDQGAEDSHDSEEETEEELDITHLVTTDEDGVMSYEDPETGQIFVFSDSDVDDEEDENDDDMEDDLFKNLTPEERFDMISNIINDREQGEDEHHADDSDEFDDDDDEGEGEEESVRGIPVSSDSFQPAFVKIGDEVEVYIKSVYKQSGRYMVTLDTPIQGRKAKDIKKETEAEKKLARLVENMGGLERIIELEGTECDGIVQAISKTGNWCYVKPIIEHLPVGIATLPSGGSAVSKGAAVRVQIQGIDESRGQLAMTVIQS